MTESKSAEILALQILQAYPSNHPDHGNPKSFECCGGNDHTPKEHTMDCMWLHVTCIEKLLAGRASLEAENARLRDDFKFANSCLKNRNEQIKKLEAELKTTHLKCPEDYLTPYEHELLTNENKLHIMVSKLEAENQRLKDIEKDHMDDWRRIQDAERKCEKLEAETQRLREALEFYAEEENWRHSVNGDCPMAHDVGDGFDTEGMRARQALAPNGAKK